MTAKRWALGGLLAACLALPAFYQAPREPVAGPVAAMALAPAPPQAVTPSVPAAQPVRERSTYAVELAVHKARADGAGEDEAYRLRAAALPARTIAELTEREQAERQWLQRMQAWRAERALLNPGDQQALRTRLFSAEEQTRLDAYEPGLPVLLK